VAGDQLVDQLRHPPPRRRVEHDQRFPERRRGHFGDERRSHHQLFAKRQRLDRDDDGHQRAEPGVDDLTSGRPTSVTDATSRTTSYLYDGSNRLTRTTAPEGNYVEHSYDARGNVTQTVAVPKAGGPTVVTSASFDSTCSNPLTCNRPNSTTDARGNVTDYTYDSTHGGVLTVTAPAPTPGAVRPQTRYSYTLTNGEYKLTGISQCQTASSCTGTADEVKSTLAYDVNGNVTSTSSGNGSGTLTATAAMTYDGLGNLLTVDGPLAGAADTGRTRYNSARQVIGTVSPDPDGGGALKHRAVRNTYDSSTGLLVKVEQGNVNSQSDGDWAAFAPAQATETVYDSNARPVVVKAVSGSTVYALGQVSYDALGRPECSAQRMNPAAFGSLPASACSLGTQGSNGPDRISKTFYDAAGRVTQTKSALGTADEANEVTTTYTTNGLVQTVTDAENNKTTYEYDGHDRLSKTFFPSAIKGAGTSSATDYEQLTYENTAGGARTSGTVSSLRNRAGETAGFTSDALGRVTFKDLPGSEPDVTYAYDLPGRMTSAATAAQTLSLTWDALGRNLTQAGPHGTVTSTWDIAGRRTQITHPDGFYVDQDYLVTGEPTAIRENGASSGAGVLAAYGYDNLGRRSSLTRGDGSVLSYGYDAVSRLTSLGDNLAGTAYDQTLGFSYNPASQIASNMRSNDAYAWIGHYNLNRSYTANGLNQYSATGSIAPTYDSKGNLTSAGATTYAYTSENLLTSASGGIALAYDPASRLYQTSGGSAGTTRFGYDGSALIAEYNGSNALLRRYVHGPGTDEPLVWYEGSGTSDRRFLHSDERGSVVAVTNSSGTTLNVNGYDEHGIPSSGNVGRFQYTGQTWLPELGMYYFKARIYSPTLGRFLQPDPIGYGDGMNMYAYVGGDPMNFTDPTGTRTYDDAQSQFADYSEEWEALRGPNLKGARSRDGMGMWDIVRMAGGRHETLAFERDQAPHFYAAGGRWSTNEHAHDTAFPMIGGDPLGAGMVFSSLTESLARLLNPNYIGETPREVRVSDLGTTEGGIFSVWGTIHRSRDTLAIHIYNIEARGFGRTSVVMQGLNTAISTAQSLGLNRVVVTGVLANPALDRFLRSGLGHPGSTFITSGGVDFLTIPVPEG
jgi:RHS repeat-associated protein